MSNGRITKVNSNDSVVHKLKHTHVSIININVSWTGVYVLRGFIRNQCHKLHSLIRSKAFTFMCNRIISQTFKT